MTPALNSLSQRIAARLSSSQRDDHYLHNDFHALASAALDMEKRFDKAEKIPLPPQKMRLAALRRLRLAQELTEREWRMVFYGLADNDPSYPDQPVLLEDDTFFPEVNNAIKKRLETKTLKRRDWAALCSSYFAYHKPALVRTAWSYRSGLHGGESGYTTRKIVDENH